MELRCLKIVQMMVDCFVECTEAEVSLIYLITSVSYTEVTETVSYYPTFPPRLLHRPPTLLLAECPPPFDWRI